MKDNEKIFDLLEHADDNIIDDIAGYSKDSDRMKQKVFAASEKKFNSMDKDFDKNGETTVRGVEEYNRPIWYRTVCAAAAFALVAGGVGVFGLIKKSAGSSSSIVPAAEVTEPDETEDTDIAEMTEADEVNEQTFLSDEEMKALFDEYLPVYLEAEWFNAADRINENTEKISFSVYYTEKKDWYTDDSPVPDGMTEIDGIVYCPQDFYKLDDPRFSTLDDIRNYYGQYLKDPDTILGIGGDYSQYQPGDVVITDGYAPEIITYNGDIYVQRSLKTSMTPDDWADNIISEKSLYVEEDRFTWEKIVKINTEYWGETASAVDMSFVKDEAGNWKCDCGTMCEERYSPEKDYNSLKNLMIDSDYLPQDCPMNVNMILQKADEYVTDNYGADVVKNCDGWEYVSVLPDYYHVTDDFVNNGNWIRANYNTPDDALLGPVGVYLDENGTVFGLDWRE
ncbi:MAG TPA: hypothetical protein P5191_07610 [Ruminococcus sp.]|nr:hypothetical protein [Ruminococcus sp.]